MSPRTSLAFALLVSISLAACRSGSSEPERRPTMVLFVGNSLTFFNDLPLMVEQLAAADDSRTFETSDVSQPSFALDNHWNHVDSRAALAEGGWDFVILQQGPSSLAASQEHLATWASIWADTIRSQGGIPALYMVWPAGDRISAFDDVSHSYSSAAAAADAELYPAGDAWRAAWALDLDLPLYGDDGFHPSVMGTYLAALTIYRGLTGREPPSLPGLGISASDDETLQRAARQAVTEAMAASLAAGDTIAKTP